MDSSKSRAKPMRGALEPRRRPGRERVAALMEAAASVIAERGYEAATMAEIAARAGALVGSLYHFFPNKVVLADALVERYTANIDEAFARIEDQAGSMPIEALADALLDFVVERLGESKAIQALLEARTDLSARRDEFRKATLQRIAGILTLRAPRLEPELAKNMAVVLLHNMKTMKDLATDREGGQGPSAELREMTRLYLASKLADSSS